MKVNRWQELENWQSLLPSSCAETDGGFADPYLRVNVPDIQKYAEKQRQRYGILPANSDNCRVLLIGVDIQNCFSYPIGSLYVAGRDGLGAITANFNFSRFVARYPQLIDRILCSMDTHEIMQIFFPSAHLRADGSSAAANTDISAEEYELGAYCPNVEFAKSAGVNIDWLKMHVIHYCRTLETAGKPKLHLWPFHGLQGGWGQELAAPIEIAKLYHSFLRQTDNRPLIKGLDPLTEFYSIFEPEVLQSFDGRELAARNLPLMHEVLDYDVIIAGGLASSHCFRETIQSLLKRLREIGSTELAKKIYILDDCIAPVVIPGVIDFTDLAESALAEFQEAGMNRVKSTDPLESWPGLMDILGG